jgi:hypothetical protein
MDKLDEELIKRVEHVLTLKLKDWQINYILGIPMVLDMKITGRGTGKTLAYILKLLFLEDTPIKAYDINEICKISDSYCVCSRMDDPDIHYNIWFRDYLREIYNLLTDNGLITRPVFLTETDYRVYRNGRGSVNENMCIQRQ